jgi:hypothetical protein
MSTNQQLIERSVVVSLPNDRPPTEDEIHDLANRLRMAFPVSDEEFAAVLHRITAKVPISMDTGPPSRATSTSMAQREKTRN